MPEPLVAEQGDVEALVGVLKDLRGFAETVRPDSTPAQVAAAKDTANRGLLLLDRLAAALARTKRELEGTGHALANADRALERAERERDNANIQHLDLLRRAESAEQERDESDAELLDVHNRAEKAERALAKIELSEPDWAKGVDENCETLRSIAQAALHSSEKASDE